MKVIGTERIPIKMWLDNVEDSAMVQIKNLANLPFAYHHVAIMPDCHSGYGMPIGGVLATENVIIPNAVGVDIGCGMCAVKTPWTIHDFDKETLKQIMGEIRKAIPVGFGHQSKDQSESWMPEKPGYYQEDASEFTSKYTIISSEYNSTLKQIGTLGGGNHFIEIQKDVNENIWIMIHSGSRNLGYKVAKYYNDLAKKLNTQWHVSVPAKYDLAFLPVDSDEGISYIAEMNYCVEFALANRQLMMERIAQIFHESLPFNVLVDLNSIINIAHNYASLEHHFGKDVWIHRKGATLVREGTIGIIPGSQGTKSYIVEGKGNPDSFMSCSHGAGRTMSRTKAQNELKLDEEIAKLDTQGIIHSIRNQKDLDEASGAYKNISEVMDNQIDLVNILVELTPLAVIKG